MSKLLLISHLGLGDGININGAIRYLSKFYNEIFIISKPHNVKNLINFYFDCNYLKIIEGYDNDISDIYNKFSGDKLNIGLNNSFSNSINNKDLLNLSKDRKMFNNHFLSQMYHNSLLDLNIYNNYFKVSSTEKSKQLYQIINQFKIIFIHEQSSNYYIDLTNDIKKCENNILICSNRNFYNENEGEKFLIAAKFVNIMIIDYYDTIINAEEIYISDSCFSSFIIPLTNQNKINSSKIYIYPRSGHDYINELCPKSQIVRK